MTRDTLLVQNLNARTGTHTVTELKQEAQLMLTTGETPLAVS